jgi:hypothetical protein
VRKVIVTTTINPPTEAIAAFQALKDWELVVVGDLRTPADYRLERGVYVTPAEQESYDRALSDAIGWNCIQRRNFGLLWAHDMKADWVAVVDDDNIPQAGWGEDLLLDREVEVNFYETELPAFDPVGATNYPELWHRGFPLQLLSRRDYSRRGRRKVRVDLQADLWNGDPDVDAFCRMEHAPRCDFAPGAFPLASNALSPCNSQNTFLSARVLSHYFLYPHIGRMDDIWASYYVQALGFRAVYQRPSVYQPHKERNLVRELQQEYVGYENNLALVQALAHEPDAILRFLPERAVLAWELYRRHFA